MNLSVLTRKSRSFIRMGLRDKILLFRAFILSGIVRLAILYLPFRKLKVYLGIPNRESSYEVETEAYTLARKVAWAVNKASRYTPWESKCLVKAITAQQMLKRNRIHSTLYLGVNKDKNNNLQAHAWLRCGEIFITGANEKSDFKKVAKFSKN